MISFQDAIIRRGNFILIFIISMIKIDIIYLNSVIHFLNGFGESHLGRGEIGIFQCCRLGLFDSGNAGCIGSDAEHCERT